MRANEGKESLTTLIGSNLINVLHTAVVCSGILHTRIPPAPFQSQPEEPPLLDHVEQYFESKENSSVSGAHLFRLTLVAASNLSSEKYKFNPALEAQRFCLERARITLTEVGSLLSPFVGRACLQSGRGGYFGG